MVIMDQVGFVAHALRDYLRPYVVEKDLQWIDSAIFAGEPFIAIMTALNFAVENHVALPPVCIENVRALDGFRGFEHQVVAESISKLPEWSLVA